MYRKKSRGWYKHKDFILIDLACLFMALILAYLIRNGSVRNLFTLGIYRNVMIFVILVDLFLIILFESYKGVLRRGRYQELRSVIRQMILIELASGLYLFTVSGGHAFSRIILYLMGIFYVLLSYCTRIIWKKRLLHKMAEGGEHSLYIVTNYDLASKVIQNVKEHNYNRYNINGLILIDKDMTGKEIAGVPVVADLNNASSFICQQWVDEVFVNVDETYPYPQELIEELLEMGMPVHVNLAKVRSTPGQKQFVEAIVGYTVLTTTMNYATDRQALAKRVLDILGGLVGCILTGVIFIFIAPAIYISSPGPIFFSQTRIGQNGKPFKMYKFRSMYMDAEERKAELMAQNKMSDGRMFKLDFDPRVIGNKILPDGTKKTGIGEFIRKTSLDEFPQFWNVLNGTMSLVGTRPILQDELRQYELHHRARIAIKPGITGMWQVSGRSDITDFEEVVRLDTEYISNWSFSLDIKILFKTVIKDIEKEFKEVIGDRIAAICSAHNVTVDYAFQDIKDIPGILPDGRTKPWGTGQAVLAAKKVIKTPFIVINADDYYGKEGFKAVHEYLVNGGKSCMAGFVLKNTLSDNGGVTRGICKMDENGNLTEVVETKNIAKTATGAEADGVVVDVNSLVSMNMWGLTPEFLDVLDRGFQEFFEKEVPENPLKAEYLIPIFIGELLEQGKMSVKVLKTNDTWYGMTYHEDVAAVKDNFKKMLEKGVYKADLFADL